MNSQDESLDGYCGANPDAARKVAERRRPAANQYPRPHPYDLADERELMRLMREIHGYLHTCVESHHGTDFQGRVYAMDALKKITSGEVGIRTY